MRSFLKEGGNDMFAQGSKSTLTKGNRNIEQRGPLGKTLPQKTTTTLPVVSPQCCHFRINIYFYKYDGYYYLSTNGNVQNFHKGLIYSHHHHEIQAVVFSSRTDMDEHVEKMVQQFAMTIFLPYTCVRMLHWMDDRLYDIQTIEWTRPQEEPTPSSLWIILGHHIAILWSPISCLVNDP
jgi:hypothetical protein